VLLRQELDLRVRHAVTRDAKVLLALAATVAACTPAPPDPRPDAAHPPASALASAPAPAPASALAPAPAPASAPAPALALSPDAGSSCRVLRGPVELPIRASAALAPRAGTLDAVFNQDGHPLTIAFPAGPPPRALAAAPETLDAGVASAPIGADVPCAIADDVYFCPDRSGAVHRANRGGDGDRVVASGRPRARIAATVVGGVHAVVAYLASRQTSEGWVTEAWIEADEDPPIRLSEDGSGATSVALALRGTSVLALTIDARAALTAMHARPVAYDRHLHLGEDAVLFVGGPGERRTAVEVAVAPSGAAVGLLPIARDMSEFGMALVTVEDPPRVDEPVSWSLYANGLDPAPLAVAVVSGRSWVLRVRPQSAEPRAAQVLELGVLAEGRQPLFSPRAVVASTVSATHAGLAVDAFGTLWATWVDASGSWLERLSCR
jgi:hypothetical protein